MSDAPFSFIPTFVSVLLCARGLRDWISCRDSIPGLSLEIQPGETWKSIFIGDDYFHAAAWQTHPPADVFVHHLMPIAERCSRELLTDETAQPG
jgi:hypothetical protein